MPWKNLVDDRRRGWSMNQIGIWTMVLRNVYEPDVQHTRVASECGFLVRERQRLDTDFHAVRRERDHENDLLYEDLVDRIYRDGRAAWSRLIDIKEETNQITRDLRHMQRMASHVTYENVERAISQAETGLAVAREVRNLSAPTNWARGHACRLTRHADDIKTRPADYPGFHCVSSQRRSRGHVGIGS